MSKSGQAYVAATHGHCYTMYAVMRTLGIPLSEEQEKQVDELAARRKREQAKLIAELDSKYADKVKDVLTPEQQQQYALVMAALEHYRAVIDDATAEMVAAVGPKMASLAATGWLKRGGDLIWALELTPQQKEAVGEISREMHEAWKKAREAIQRPADMKEPDAWRAYSEQLKAATDKLQAEVAEKRRALLTPEQTGQLKKLEAAVEVFGQKIRAAREEFLASLETGAQEK